jgi:hypothetical protein
MVRQRVFKIMCFYFFIVHASVGCTEYPKDPNNTLDKITNGTMVVGFSENAPWVIKTTGEPEGIEPD